MVLFHLYFGSFSQRQHWKRRALVSLIPTVQLYRLLIHNLPTALQRSNYAFHVSFLINVTFFLVCSMLEEYKPICGNRSINAHIILELEVHELIRPWLFGSSWCHSCCSKLRQCDNPEFASCICSCYFSITI